MITPILLDQKTWQLSKANKVRKHLDENSRIKNAGLAQLKILKIYKKKHDNDQEQLVIVNCLI